MPAIAPLGVTPRVCRLPGSASIALLAICGAIGSVPTQALAQESCDAPVGPGGSLADAKAAFAENCPTLARRDCDPLPDGGWLCSSEVIGSAAPASSTPPAVSVDAGPTPSGRSEDEPSEAEGLCYSQVQGDLSTAIASFSASCSGFVRRDCDPTSGGWRCSSGVLGSSAPAIAGESTSAPSAPSEPSPAEEPSAEAPEPDAPAAEPVQPPRAPTDDRQRDIGRLAANDLLVLHYDNCPDRDDGQAIAAGYAVVQELDLGRPLVVNGTCGDRIRRQFDPASRPVLQAVWGSDWLDAASDDSGSVSTSADRWAATLANGGKVWVAEGGPADFTARVLDRMADRYPQLDLKQVVVIQHSSGSAFNEAQSVRIATVKRLADYRAIGDGNRSGNGTADFNEQSDAFVRRARASRYASEWNAAFDYLPGECSPRTEECKLDFSDTVELLYIVDDTTTRTVTDFADRYLD